ncbi:MAG TPA: aryl-sulfate sulfotransferase [Acidimicrobiales bacterium]|nr:aryl-sulfate sulfotransferase [Acidimicrobiales bacterium]
MSRFKRLRWTTLFAVVAALVALPLAASSPGAAVTSAPGLLITTNPGMYPAFNPSITDYVVRCNNAPVLLSATVPTGTEVELNGTGDHTTGFTIPVLLGTDGSFSVTVIDLSGLGQSQSYFVRCLPPDFPDFTIAAPSQHPQAQYYMAVAVPPTLLGPTPATTQYMTLFDDDGVPVWWRAIDDKAAYATFLPDGDAAEVSIQSRAGEEYQLSGATARTIVPNDGGGVDLHELQQLPNGDYLLASIVPRTGQNLTFMGGPNNATVQDAIVKEVAPDGTVVWSWDAADHIPVTEAPSDWWNTDLTTSFGGPGYDVYHFNSASESGNDVLVSFRQLDAVYMINKTTGNIIWKLGGTTRPDGTSLTVLGDPDFPPGFGGQHDARIMPDGTITVHDDGTLRSRPPRGAQYRINMTNMTATLVQQVTDPLVASAFCCGSARLQPGGDWVMGWGFNNLITEINPSAPLTSPQFRQFLVEWTDPGLFNYRVEPVAPGVLSRPQLRADMNAYAGSPGLVP